jgi:hypothetical protein
MSITNRLKSINSTFDVFEICNMILLLPKSDQDDYVNELAREIIKKGAFENADTFHMCKIVRTKGLI